MIPESNSIRDGFIRQRRNLFVVSLVLLFYESASLVVEQVNLFGNTVKLANPARADLFLWVAWGYFLSRYYQYTRDLPDKGFATAYYLQLNKLATKLAVKRFVENYKPDPDNPGYAHDLSAEARAVRVIHASSDYWEAEIDFEVRYRIKDGHATQQPTGWKIVLHKPDLRVSKAMALLHVVANTRLATEYVLPFFVGAAPPIYMLSTKIVAWVAHQ